MAAVTTRRKPASEDVEELRAELAETRAALQVVARVAAQAAAKSAHGPWTDFGKLLTDQLSISHDDAGLFLDILAGRKP